MVGPSARGSLKGMPSSMTSAPASASARTNFRVASKEGSPAVIYATMPSSPEARSSAKRLEIRVKLGEAAAIACGKRLEKTGISVHVLVAAAGGVENDEVGLGHARGRCDEPG